MRIQRVVSGGMEDMSLEQVMTLVTEKKESGVSVWADVESGMPTIWYDTDQVDLLRACLGDLTWELRVSMQLSGHMYLGSRYESDNTCGNCDGARCDDPCVALYSFSLRKVAETSCYCDEGKSNCIDCCWSAPGAPMVRGKSKDGTKCEPCGGTGSTQCTTCKGTSVRLAVA